MVHELKILPEYFVAVRDGIKKFEVRKDDRPFEVGDILCLHEINCGVLTGRTIKAEVTYVLRHPDYCKEGYCILSIKVAQQQIVKQVDMPSTDVQPIVYAHKTINVGRRSYCSNCGKLAIMEDFCSKCGAKVKDGDTE